MRSFLSRGLPALFLALFGITLLTACGPENMQSARTSSLSGGTVQNVSMAIPAGSVNPASLAGVWAPAGSTNRVGRMVFSDDGRRLVISRPNEPDAVMQLSVNEGSVVRYNGPVRNSRGDSADGYARCAVGHCDIAFSVRGGPFRINLVKVQ